jgi:type IV secretion system protein VirD4
MQPIENAATLMRGYGVRLWLFVQSLEQLKTCYETNASTLLDNMATQQFFGITSYDTAEYISKRIGDFTQLVWSYNGGTSRTRSANRMGDDAGNDTASQGWTVSEQGRRIVRPEEVLVFPSSAGLVFHRNKPPIAIELAHHYASPEFQNGRGGQERQPGLATTLACGLVLMASLCVSTFGLAVAVMPMPTAPPVQTVPDWHFGRKPTFTASPPAGRPGTAIRQETAYPERPRQMPPGRRQRNAYR